VKYKATECVANFLEMPHGSARHYWACIILHDLTKSSLLMHNYQSEA